MWFNLLQLKKRTAGQLSDRLKFFAGQIENLPVLSYSPAVFTKTD